MSATYEREPTCVEQNNSVILAGKADETAVFSHSFRGEPFFAMKIAVPRSSGVIDLLPLTVPGALYPQAVEPGTPLLVSGQLRSYRLFDGERNRLCLSVFCKTMQLVTSENDSSNSVSLVGFLLKEPVVRRTPLGRDICDLIVSVPRAFGKTDVIPVIAWGIYAEACADFAIGDRLQIKGRFQSRGYQKKQEDGEIQQRVAYELSAMEVTLL